jgi:uncharacterized spore protein YtfJ
MDDKLDKIAEVVKVNETQSMELLGRLIEAAKPETVFSKPVKVGDTQIITASEIQVGLGYGHGLGRSPQVISNLPDQNVEESTEASLGGAGGGGGAASGRPVAVITIREDGVTVEPILDRTKVALAFFTMLGSIFYLGSQIRRGK